MLSRFHLVPERNGWTDRQTDRQTDGQTDLLYQYRARISMLTRHKNILVAEIVDTPCHFVC